MTEEELLEVIEQAARDGVTELDLSGKELSVLPPEIGKLTQLKKLILGKYLYCEQGYIDRSVGNNLRTLPKEIGLLNELEELHIVKNQLSNIPEEIGQLTKLHSLVLSKNQLSSIPGEIGQLTKLQFLHLYNNKLSSIPGEIGQLTNLHSLDLADNKLSSIPGEIVQLTNLHSLRFSYNKLISIPGEIIQLTNLQSLDLSDNELSNIPEEIGQLTNLQYLHLENNKLSSIPGEIGQLTNLQFLQLSDNELSNIPEEIGQLTNLQYLYLFVNKLSSIPGEIGQLTNLQYLHLENNKLSSIPGEIGQLTNLQYLHLENNKLSSIPGEIGQLTNLQYLHLENNKLSSIPGEIGQLTNLQFLNLSDNKLSRVPLEIGQLTKLTKLELNGNQITNLPPEIENRGTEAIVNFYKQQLEQETVYFYEAKFLIVGEGGAGKTSLAKKIEDETYELQTDEKSTEGIEVIQWNFTQPNGKDFRVNIWDFGGQEIYHQTHQFFLTERSLYALVADTRKENTDFYWWLKVVELLSDNSPVLIIKNEKQDCQCQVNERQLRGEFTNLKEVLPTNLATNRGLTKIKDTIQQYISRLSHIGTPLPKFWVRVRSDLENNSRNYILLQEYYQLCEINKLTDRKDMLILSRYLHDLGVCLHFQDDSTLKHYVILKPEWATTAVYKVLKNHTVIANLGCFTQENLADIWQDDEYTDMRDELLQLMMRFKLCYSIPNRPRNYIAPQLLDINEPEYFWEDSNNLILRYEYKFMPKGIITRFIVETHLWIEEQKIVWRSGVVLNKDGTRAEVIENYNQREIKVRVVGSRKKELLAVVTHELDKINKSFERLDYDTYVPCNCKQCLGASEPYTYALKRLHNYLDNRNYEIKCEKSFQTVEVRGLVDDINLLLTPLQKELEETRNTFVNTGQTMNLPGQQRKELQNALISAFPNFASLKQMLSFQLDKSIAVIAGEGDLNKIVFELIETAESQGWLEDLVRGACNENPGNSKLRAIAERGLTFSVSSPNISQKPTNDSTPHITIINNMNQSSDQSRKIEITGGTINANGAGAFGLGDISGNVANTINQLPASPETDKPGIKELLEQLKTAIESEPELSKDDKIEALEYIQTLAEVGQNPKEGAVQKVAKTTLRALSGIFSSLPAVAKLAEASKTLIPMIASIFGL